MKKWTLLLDMDEVICDFIGGACRIHGVTREQFEAVRKPGEWAMNEPLEALKRLSGPISQTEFWKPIHEAGAAFWRGLHSLPWAEEIYVWLHHRGLQLGDDFEWHLISAPSIHPSSYEGKVHWIKKRFGGDFTRFALTPHKELFARPNTVLVDDREENLSKFREAGGKGIIFPSRGNSLHALSADPVSFVLPQLEKLLCT